jgi:ABC-type transporter Mla subunit MlaD
MSHGEMSEGATPDPAAALRNLLPGLAWTQAMIEGPARAQAAVAAQALRQLNEPVVATLTRQRELATALAEAAEQLRVLYENLERMARQYAEVTDAMQAALDPYLRYVDWLAAIGSGTAAGARDDSAPGAR